MTEQNYHKISRECGCGQKYNYVYNSKLGCFIQVCPKCNNEGDNISFDDIKNVHHIIKNAAI